MIVIEGADLVGKTTLAMKLAARLALNYKHLSRPADDFDRFWDYLPMIQSRNILDRFIMSEPVYAAARSFFAEEPEDMRLRPDLLVVLQREQLAAGCFTIVITADEDLIQSRWREGEMYNLETVFEANSLFRQIGSTGQLLDYDFYLDLHIHCTAEMPFVDDASIEQIINLHQLCVNRAAYLKGTREFPIPSKA